MPASDQDSAPTSATVIPIRPRRDTPITLAGARRPADPKVVILADHRSRRFPAAVKEMVPSGPTQPWSSRIPGSAAVLRGLRTGLATVRRMHRDTTGNGS